MSVYFVRSLCTKHCFKYRNYKMLPRAENFRLCMTAMFNKNDMNTDLQFFKYVVSRKTDSDYCNSIL
jgi:hypothetical protein